MKGPEDSTAWNKKIDAERRPNPNTVCKGCKVVIIVWHCGESGCVWCAECGAKARDLREKRKNGEA